MELIRVPHQILLIAIVFSNDSAQTVTNFKTIIYLATQVGWKLVKVFW